MAPAQTIYTVARAGGMPPALANLIVAQARHETGDFTSSIFKTCRNAFGYKYAGQKLPVRPCSDSPEGNYYASYPDLTASVNELVAWIRRRQTDGKFPKNLNEITTAGKYALLLKAAGFYGDTVANYTNGLLKFGGGYAAGIGAGGIAIIATIAIIAMRKK